MGLRAEEKGSKVIDVVSLNPKVAKYDILYPQLNEKEHYHASVL